MENVLYFLNITWFLNYVHLLRRIPLPISPITKSKQLLLKSLTNTQDLV